MKHFAREAHTDTYTSMCEAACFSACWSWALEQSRLLKLAVWFLRSGPCFRVPFVSSPFWTKHCVCISSLSSCQHPFAPHPPPFLATTTSSLHCLPTVKEGTTVSPTSSTKTSGSAKGLSPMAAIPHCFSGYSLMRILPTAYTKKTSGTCTHKHRKKIFVVLGL